MWGDRREHALAKPELLDDRALKLRRYLNNDLLVRLCSLALLFTEDNLGL